MNVIVLHGDDTEKSYARLTKFISVAKRRGWDIVNDKIEETPSLFGTEKLIIVRDYKVLDKKGLNLIEKLPGTLVVYHQKILSKTFLNILPNDTKIETYELPFLLWKFLDSFESKNKISIKLFHELIKTQAVEYVFAMIAWKLRKMYISNPSKEIGKMITELAKIDIDVKTGKGQSLKDSLDLFIVKRLA